MQVSNEVDALLRMYRGRKLISVKDIIEFSLTWTTIQQLGVDFTKKKENKDE